MHSFKKRSVNLDVSLYWDILYICKPVWKFSIYSLEFLSSQECFFLVLCAGVFSLLTLCTWYSLILTPSILQSATGLRWPFKSKQYIIRQLKGNFYLHKKLWIQHSFANKIINFPLKSGNYDGLPYLFLSILGSHGLIISWIF